MSEVVVKPGKDTTEYAETKSSSTWAIVVQVLGVLVTVGGAVATALGTDGKWGIIVGGAVTVIATVKETIVKAGYIQSRTQVKVAAELAKPEFEEE